MKIWVDADAVPGDIKEIIIRAAMRLGIPTKFVANKDIKIPRHPLITAQRVAKGPDVADTLIAEGASAGDLVISADIPLAALIVAKGGVVIDPRGEVLTEASIGERVSVRDFMHGLREAGMVTGGPPPLDGKAKQRFAAALDSSLAKLHTRKDQPNS